MSVDTKKKLNIGCGNYTMEDAVNLDMIASDKVDVVHDIEKMPYPFEDGRFEAIYAYHILEHTINFQAVMRELQRILAAGGKLIVRVPHFSSNMAFVERHTRFFRYRSFEPICIDRRDAEQEDLYRFEIVRRKITFMKKPVIPFFYNSIAEWIFNKWKFPLVYEKTFLRNLFPAEEIYFELQKPR